MPCILLSSPKATKTEEQPFSKRKKTEKNLENTTKGKLANSLFELVVVSFVSPSLLFLRDAWSMYVCVCEERGDREERWEVVNKRNK